MISIRFTFLLFGILLMIQTTAQGQASLKLELQGHIGSGRHNKQNLEKVIQDAEISSPKSVRFSKDGSKIYINSLEGGITVVYSWPQLKKMKSIYHRFNANNEYLFHDETTVFNYPYYSSTKNPNHFLGKPVESELSPDGRWLWIPYYRRSFDNYGQSPGAIAIIDTSTDEIVRVMPTGPIPKYVVTSPDGRYVAVVHWGDNTIGLIDTSSNDPQSYHYVSHLKVEKPLSQQGLNNTDRDKTCGFCLRGAVFSQDSRYLLVARMGKGGIAGFDVINNEYLGSIMNIKSTPRHLILSPDGETLYVSSNALGYVSKAPMDHVISELVKAKGQRISGPRWEEVFVGQGARTIDISSDGKYLFAAVNISSSLVALETNSMKPVGSIPISPYPVGLAVAPDTSAIILTSQGRNGVGGNAVTIVKTNLVK